MEVAIEKAVEKVSDFSVHSSCSEQECSEEGVEEKVEGNKIDEEKKKLHKLFVAVDDDDMDPTQYYENRIKYVASLKMNGLNPYPHKFHVSISVKEFIQKYTSLNDGEHLKDVEVNIAGRIMKKKNSSFKLYFYELCGDGVNVQVMADARDSDLDEVEFSRLHANVKRGDIVGICGYPGKSEREALSVFSKKLVVLSYSFHLFPQQKAASGGDKLFPTRTRSIGT